MLLLFISFITFLLGGGGGLYLASLVTPHLGLQVFIAFVIYMVTGYAMLTLYQKYFSRR